MLLKTIFIAIFVAVYCKKESESGINKFRECANDREFKIEIDNAQDFTVLLIVTKQANNKINRQLKKHFCRNRKIQVNLDQCKGECDRTVKFLQVNPEVKTSVRWMKSNILVPNLLVEMNNKFEKDLLEGAYRVANEMPTTDKTRVSQQIGHWFLPPTQPMLHTGPQAGSQEPPFQIPSGFHPAPRGLPQVMPSFLAEIPAGQSAGSSMTDSQRAVWTPVYQQQPVQRVDSSLPQASASGSSAQLSRGQQSRPPTASVLRPVQKIQKQPPRSHGGGTSRGTK